MSNKVLFVKPPMRAGAFYFRIEQYMDFFRRRGYGICVFYPAPDGSTLLEKLSFWKIIKKTAFSLKHFGKFLRDLARTNLVIIFPSPTSIIYAVLTKLMTKKLVIEHIVSYISHKDLFPKFPFFFDVMIYRMADVVVTHTESMKEELLRRYNLKNEKIIVIHCDIDLKLFSPSYDKEAEELKLSLGIQDKKVIFYHGLHHPWHALDLLLKAIEIVNSKRNDVVLVVLPGKSSKDIERKGNVIYLSENKHYSWKTLPIYIQMADVWASGFRNTERGDRSFGSTLIQAMGMARPIVTSSSKEKDKFLKDNVNVFYAKPESPKDIAEKIFMLLESAENRARIGLKARETAEKFFSNTTLEQQLSSIL